MFPSNQAAGIGLHASYGGLQGSADGPGGSGDDPPSLPTFGWPPAVHGSSSSQPGSLFSGVTSVDQSSRHKMAAEQLLDQRSYLNVDGRTPSMSRLGSQSAVSASSSAGAPGSTTGPQDSSSSSSRFHPYRPSTGGGNTGGGAGAGSSMGAVLAGMGHSAASLAASSQYAAFDSLYKAYQAGAYNPAAAAAVASVYGGGQPGQYGSLLSDQQLMLQASMLHYPHLGVFPSPALYPSLAAAAAAAGGGVRFPGDYYSPGGLSAAAMGLSAKYPEMNASAANWLGLDSRSHITSNPSIGASGDGRSTDKDLKDQELRKEQHESQSGTGKHSVSGGDKMSSTGSGGGRSENRGVDASSSSSSRHHHHHHHDREDRRGEHGGRASSNHSSTVGSGEKDGTFKKEQRSSGVGGGGGGGMTSQQTKNTNNIGKSPGSYPDQRSHQDYGLGRYSDNLVTEYMFPGVGSTRAPLSAVGGGGLVGFSPEPLNLRKLSGSSPGVAGSGQQQTRSGSDRDRMPDRPDHTASSRDRHHQRRVDDASKMAPLTLSIPKSSVPSHMTTSTTKPSLEPKFHRPFEAPSSSSSSSLIKPVNNASTEAMYNSYSKQQQLAMRSQPQAGVRNNASVVDHHRGEASMPAISGIDWKTTAGTIDANNRQQQQIKTQHELIRAQQGGEKRHGASGKNSRAPDELPLNLALAKHSSVAARSNFFIGKPSVDIAVPTGFLPMSQSSTNVAAIKSHRLPQSRNDLSSPVKSNKPMSPASMPAPVCRVRSPVSHFDMELARRRKRRAMKEAAANASEAMCAGGSGGSEDDEGAEDGAELLNIGDTGAMARLLLITTGPTLKDPPSERKCEFLAGLGLATTGRHQEILFEQRRKRRRIFRERSISPTRLANSCVAPTIDDINLLFASSRISPLFSSVLVSESIYSGLEGVDKTSFLSLFGLIQSKAGKEQHNQLAAELSLSLLRGSDIYGSSSASSSSTYHPLSSSSSSAPSSKKNGNRTAVPGSSSAVDTGLIKKGVSYRPPNHLSTETGRLNFDLEGRSIGSDLTQFAAGHEHGRRDVPASGLSNSQSLYGQAPSQLSPLIGCGDQLLVNVDVNHGIDISDRADARYPHTDSSTPYKILPVPGLPSSSTPAGTTTINSAGSKLCSGGGGNDAVFLWPGVDTIIESFHHYIEEQALEKQLLKEQSRRVRHRNTDLRRVADRLKAQMSELTRKQQQLVSDRTKLQSTVASLKRCMKFFQQP